MSYLFLSSIAFLTLMYFVSGNMFCYSCGHTMPVTELANTKQRLQHHLINGDTIYTHCIVQLTRRRAPVLKWIILQVN